MVNATGVMLTMGELVQQPCFAGLTRRQVEYAIESNRIDPAARAGITRLFSEAQIPRILAAVRRTSRVEFR